MAANIIMQTIAASPLKPSMMLTALAMPATAKIVSGTEITARVSSASIGPMETRAITASSTHAPSKAESAAAIMRLRGLIARVMSSASP